MVNKVSTATKPPQVYSTKYVNDPHLGYPNDLITGSPGKMDRGMPHSFSFHNKTATDGWDALMAHSITPYPVLGNDGLNFVIATANNKYILPAEDIRKYGMTLNPLDENAAQMDGWKRATEVSHELESVKLPDKSSGLVRYGDRMPKYSQYGMTEVNKIISTHKIFGEEFKANDYGKYLSKVHNQEIRLKNSIFINNLKDRPWYNKDGYTHLNETALDFFKERFGEGNAGGRVKGIGYGDLSGMKALAATYNKNTIIVSDNLYSDAWKLAEKNNLSGREAQEFVDRYIESVILYHEGSHVIDRAGKPYDVTEMDIGANIGDFFGRKAKDKEGTLEGRVAKLISNWHERYSEKYAGKIGRLAGKYKEEAESMGMDEKEATEYVESKLEETIDDDIKENYSEKDMESIDNNEYMESQNENNAEDNIETIEADAVESE